MQSETLYNTNVLSVFYKVRNKSLSNYYFFKGCVDSLCIASAHWLNDILSEQMMFPPRTSLHYPIAFKDAPEWCHKLVSLSSKHYV